MSQALLAKALLDPNAVPQPRFAIHRNNVLQSLIAALEAGFPVTRRLVGNDFFTAMARIFVHQHPPDSALMMLYGVDFPRFLQNFAPLESLPYLPDLATLEQALRESYHAADATPIPPEVFATLTEAHRLTLAPALRLIRSDWPIWAIWTTGGAAPLPRTESTDVIILRPGFDPVPHPLPAGGGPFIGALLQGQSLGQALSSAPRTLDLTSVLTLLLHGNGLVSLT